MWLFQPLAAATIPAGTQPVTAALAIVGLVASLRHQINLPDEP